MATGTAVARRALVVCGGAVFRRVFERIDPAVTFESLVPEGTLVEAGAALWFVRGSARALLSGERTALNLVQRMSGIATLARRFVEALPAGSATRIADTRKTTPGPARARALRGPRRRRAQPPRQPRQRRAHQGQPHRRRGRHHGGHCARPPSRTPHHPHRGRGRDPGRARARPRCARRRRHARQLHPGRRPRGSPPGARARRPRPLVEVSGGITLERIPELALAGVDVDQRGALTHSAPAADIALDLEL